MQANKKEEVDRGVVIDEKRKAGFWHITSTIFVYVSTVYLPFGVLVRKLKVKKM